MANSQDAYEVADSLQSSVARLLRKLRHLRTDGGLSMPANSALALLQREGPRAAADLARSEQISPQSMGATLSTLERSGLVSRGSDPADGRRIVFSVTDAGVEHLRRKRDGRSEQLAVVLAEFSEEELRVLRSAAPLLERMAEKL